MALDKAILKKTNISRYIHREFIECLIICSLISVLGILGMIFIKDHKLETIVVMLTVIMYQIINYSSILTTVNVVRLENFRALNNSIDKIYDLLVAAWASYNVKEANRIKAQWDEIVHTASEMRENGLISEDAYSCILKSNVEYTYKETKIRLENMR